MNEFEYITTDERLLKLVEDFKTLDAIAIDFEEECNLHIYGEHISIIQIYDNAHFYIVDVLAKGITDKGLEVLFTSPVEKIWFECHSDLSILYKKHHIKACNVYDLRVLAKALGDMHGLDAVLKAFLGIDRGGAKKKNQRENWMKRPIADEMLSYALKDVEYLFSLKEVLLNEVRERKLLKQVEASMKHVAEIKSSKPGWMKICNFYSLSSKERIYLKHIFIAREKTAERFNTPGVNVLEKKEVVNLAKLSPLDKDGVMKFMERAPTRYRKFITDAVVAAMERASEEIRGKV